MYSPPSGKGYPATPHVITGAVTTAQLPRVSSPLRGASSVIPGPLEIRVLPMAPFFTATWLLAHPCPCLLPLPPNPPRLPSLQMPQLGPPEPVPKPEGTAHSWSKTTYTQLAPNSIPRVPFPTEPVPGRPWPLHPCREGWGTHMQSVHTESWSLLPPEPPLPHWLRAPRARAGNRAAAPETDEQQPTLPLPGGRAWARRGPGGSV